MGVMRDNGGTLEFVVGVGTVWTPDEKVSPTVDMHGTVTTSPREVGTQTKGHSMKVTLCKDQYGDIEVHAAGCRDLGKKHKVETIEASTCAEVAADWWQDFIAEGSMTLDDALRATRFLPCCSDLS